MYMAGNRLSWEATQDPSHLAPKSTQSAARVAAVAAVEESAATQQRVAAVTASAAVVALAESACVDAGR